MMFNNPHMPSVNPGQDAMSWLSNYAQQNGVVMNRYISGFHFLNTNPPVGFPQEIQYVHNLYRQNPFLIPNQILQHQNVIQWLKNAVTHYQQTAPQVLMQYIQSQAYNINGPIQTQDPNLQLMHAILRVNSGLIPQLAAALNQSVGIGMGMNTGMGMTSMVGMTHTSISSLSGTNFLQTPGSIGNGFNAEVSRPPTSSNRYHTPALPAPPPVTPALPNTVQEPTQIEEKGGVVTAEQIESLTNVGGTKRPPVLDENMDESEVVLVDNLYSDDTLTGAVLNSSRTRLEEGDVTLVSQLIMLENPWYGVDHFESFEKLFSKTYGDACDQMHRMRRSAKLQMTLTIYNELDRHITDLINDRLLINFSDYRIDSFFSDYKALTEAMGGDGGKVLDHLADINSYLSKVFQLMRTYKDKDDRTPVVARTCIPEVAVFSALKRFKNDISYDTIPVDQFVLLSPTPMFKMLHQICEMIRDKILDPPADMAHDDFLKMATRFYITTMDYGCVEVAYSANYDDFFVRRAA